MGEKNQAWLGLSGYTQRYPWTFGILRIGWSANRMDIKTIPQGKATDISRGEVKMHAILFIVVLLLAAPLILYASPVIIYLLPFVLIGLGLSLFAEYVRRKDRAARH